MIVSEKPTAWAQVNEQGDLVILARPYVPPSWVEYVLSIDISHCTMP